jgi:hypothetical protein
MGTGRSLLFAFTVTPATVHVLGSPTCGQRKGYSSRFPQPRGLICCENAEQSSRSEVEIGILQSILVAGPAARLNVLLLGFVHSRGPALVYRLCEHSSVT